MTLRQGTEWVLLGAIWGAAFLFTRMAVPEFGQYAMVEIRLSVAAMVLLVCVHVKGEWKYLLSNWKPLLLLGVINSAIPFTLFAYALKSLTAGDGAVLNATAPLFAAAIGGIILREKLPWGRWLGLCVGFAGVVILVQDKLSFEGNYWAIAAGLGAAFLYGVASHIINRYLKGVPSFSVSAGTLLFASLALLPFALGKIPSEMPSAKAWGAVLALGLVCTALAFVMYFQLLKEIGATKSMTVAYLIPAFGILWGYLVLNEPVPPSTLLGGTVIVIGTMLVHFVKGKQAKGSPEI